MLSLRPWLVDLSRPKDFGPPFEEMPVLLFELRWLEASLLDVLNSVEA